MFEYADQSSGRRLPDDQLEFYLDQIDSGWTFSRIKQDIAESLERISQRVKIALSGRDFYL